MGKTFKASSAKQRGNMLLQYSGLYPFSRHGSAYIEANTAEKTTTKGFGHGCAFDTAEIRAPQICQRHGDDRCINPITFGVFKNLHNAALENLKIAIFGQAAFGEDGQQITLAQHFGGSLKCRFIKRRVFTAGCNGYGFEEFKKPAPGRFTL